MAKGLLFNLEQNGISGKTITRTNHFLSYRKQRVVLNSQHSSWADLKPGLPQGLIIVPQLFLLYNEDLRIRLNLKELWNHT